MERRPGTATRGQLVKKSILRSKQETELEHGQPQRERGTAPAADGRHERGCPAEIANVPNALWDNGRTKTDRQTFGPSGANRETKKSSMMAELTTVRPAR
jgi:hypothetical protein